MPAVIFIHNKKIYIDSCENFKFEQENIIEDLSEYLKLDPHYVYWNNPHNIDFFQNYKWVYSPPYIKFFCILRCDSGVLILLDSKEHSNPNFSWFSSFRELLDQWLNMSVQLEKVTKEIEFYKMLANTTTDCIVYGDLNGVRLYISPSVKKLLGYEPEMLIGKRAVDITHPDDIPALKLLMEKIKEGSLDIAVLELRQQHQNGDWIWMEASLRLVKENTQGLQSGYVVSVRNIELRKALEHKLQLQATRDVLTGLYNRKYFCDFLENAFASSSEKKSPLTLFFMDIDKFKYINDHFGHHSGDKIITEVASRLSGLIPDDGVLARIGGDEFTLLIFSEISNATKIAENFIHSISKPFSLEGKNVYIGISIGISYKSLEVNSYNELMELADKALYSAKRRGRNNYCLANGGGGE